MIIILAFGVFALLLAGLMLFLFKDFIRFLVKYIKGSYKIPKVFYDFGELVVSFVVVCSISICSFVLYKTLTAVTAYLISSDLLAFFTILRNVFSTTAPDLQYPFSGSNLLAGFLISPALEFISIWFLILATRGFATTMNKKYKSQIYSEGDAIFMEFLGTLLFILIEINFYSQQIPSFFNQIFHFIYLSASKLAIITFLFSIEHARYVKQFESYRTSLQEYVVLSKVEKAILFNPLKILLFTYINGALINIPFFLGEEFLSGTKLFFLFLFNAIFFSAILKLIFASGWNYLAVVLLAENSKNISHFNFLQKFKPKKLFLLIFSSILALVFILLKPKLFLFVLFIAILVVFLFVFIHSFLYLIGLGLSIFRANVRHYQTPSFNPKDIYKYLLTTVESLALAILPLGIILLFVIFTLSIFPKTFKFCNEDVVNAVVDRAGNPLFIEEAKSNQCVAIPNSAVDTLFFKLLYCQEDREFNSQNSWLPMKSNWHGFSLSGLRVLSGQSGSSNLNMQCLKNLAYRSFPQDVSRKFSESLCSYELSIQKTPAEIVNYYINCVGFAGGIGGNEGLFSASLYIYGRSVENINPLEFLFLVISLKRGQSFKASSGLVIPYSEIQGNKDLIKRELIHTSESWQEQGLLTKKEVNRLRKCELRFTNQPYRIETATTTKEFIKKFLPQNSLITKTYCSSISLENQKKMGKAVSQFETQFHQFKRVGNSILYNAAIVVNVKTGAIIAHDGGSLGVTDLTTFGAGFPIASLIKPFILIEMLEHNIPVSLYDGKIAGRKTPENYDHHYSNRMVGVTEIISKSLNGPMGNIDERTSTWELISEVELRFQKMGIQADPYMSLNDSSRKKEIKYNYCLGSRNMKLVDVLQAYQTILNDGKWAKLSVLNSGFDPMTNKTEGFISPTKMIYSPESTRIIKGAMAHTLEGTAFTIKKLLPSDRIFYAKTGTSDKALKGYTILSDGEILILTFISYEKDVNGKSDFNHVPPIPFQSGGHSAGILAALIYNQLCSKR